MKTGRQKSGYSHAGQYSYFENMKVDRAYGRLHGYQVINNKLTKKCQIVKISLTNG
jgi:hypothetical protein